MLASAKVAPLGFRCGDGSLNRAGADKLSQRVERHALDLGDLPSCHPCRPPAVKTGIAARKALFCVGRPLAVSRFVAFALVKPVQGLSFWPLAHVIQEGVERVAPAVAHLNPGAAVRPVLGIVRVVAALLGCLPGPISGRARHAMAAVPVSGAFALVAAATGCVSAGKFMAGGNLFRSALAFANPPSSLSLRGRTALKTADHFQPPVDVSGPINQSRHWRFPRG